MSNGVLSGNTADSWRQAQHVTAVPTLSETLGNGQGMAPDPQWSVVASQPRGGLEWAHRKDFLAVFSVVSLRSVHAAGELNIDGGDMRLRVRAECNATVTGSSIHQSHIFHACKRRRN